MRSHEIVACLPRLSPASFVLVLPGSFVRSRSFSSSLDRLHLVRSFDRSPGSCVRPHGSGSDRTTSLSGSIDPSINPLDRIGFLVVRSRGSLVRSQDLASPFDHLVRLLLPVAFCLVLPARRYRASFVDRSTCFIACYRSTFDHAVRSFAHRRPRVRSSSMRS